jgi:hypothetical protein
MILLFLPAVVSAFEGPLQVKNQFPPFVGISQPFLESAAPSGSLSLGLSHSSVYIIESRPSWTVNLDLELTELDVRYKKNFPGLFEVGVEVPVYRPIAGFMDGFLEWYHGTFGFPDYGRSDRPENDFLYEVRHDGAVIVRGVNGRAGLGDVRLSLKRLVAGGDPLVSVMASVELPTGEADTGYGNGSVDTALAVMLDKKLGDIVTAYTNLGVVFPGDLRAYQTVPLNTFAYGGIGLEGSFWEKFSILTQVSVQSSPYPTTGIGQIDTPAVILVIGGRYRGDSGDFEFSLTEDPNTSGAPDFVLNATYTLRL